MTETERDSDRDSDLDCPKPDSDPDSDPEPETDTPALPSDPSPIPVPAPNPSPVPTPRSILVTRLSTTELLFDLGNGLLIGGGSLSLVLQGKKDDMLRESFIGGGGFLFLFL
ncbi:hypothetical protein ZIOFF_040908 [Zingiber officinale]|uniref:Uncharacterized protein n=1 Tax=Zingiber officinale TaxID=94328 RepID=A0A8J5L1D3_ZINOF|nr:hypothetical protein ZIOFF_040908 [Zingiber officinale]